MLVSLVKVGSDEVMPVGRLIMLYTISKNVKKYIKVMARLYEEECMLG